MKRPVAITKTQAGGKSGCATVYRSIVPKQIIQEIIDKNTQLFTPYKKQQKTGSNE